MKNKKGFTLVELLAVIIVLAVVAVISIPVIGNLIDKAKKDMLRDSAINLVDSGKTYYANALMDNDEGLESSKKFTIGENINELDFKGRLPSSGYLEISTKGDISLAVVSGEYCAKKEFYDTEIIITDNLNECNVSGIDKAETVNDSCFVFNAKTRTITGYNFSKKDCDKPNIAIPATIGDIPVEHIAPGAFVQDSDGALAMYYDPNGNEEEFMDIYENASYYKEAFGYEMALVFPVRNIKQNFGKYCVSNNPGITMDDVRYDYEYLNESSITKVMSVTSSRDKCYAMPKGEASEEEVVAFGTRLDSIDFSDATNLKSIGDYAFFATSLSSIKFGDNPVLDRIGNSAFIYNELQNLDLSGLSSLYEIENSVFINNYLTTVKFPNSLSIIGNQAFRNNFINSINVPTSLEYIGEYAFTDNYIRRFDAKNSNLETIGYEAFRDNAIEYITLPEGLTYIAPYAFQNNYLGNLVIPSTLYRVGYNAFYNSGITSLTLKEGVSIIENYAFSENYNLRTVSLPEGLTYIGYRAFYGSNLTEVIIPASVESIESRAFYSNLAWEKVTILYDVEAEKLRFNFIWSDIGWPIELLPTINPRETTFVNSEPNDYEYFGSYYIVNIPTTGRYKLEVWGAQGGSYSSYSGGYGGYSSGIINISSLTTVYVYVGGQPNSTSNIEGVVPGGFNGGGNGANRYYSGVYTYGQGGGGATDIRIGTDSLYARVIVAGGGGGSASTYDSTIKYGGGLSGGSSFSEYVGTQVSAGEGGAFGVGASSSPNGLNYQHGPGGGGGGWYGGGAIDEYADGDESYRTYNGGGSGWIYTADSFSTWQTGNSTDAANWLLNNTYYLTEATTAAGNTSFLNPNGTTVTGHSGNGYARITKVG